MLACGLAPSPARAVHAQTRPPAQHIHMARTTYRHVYYCCSPHCSPVSAACLPACLRSMLVPRHCAERGPVQAQVLQAGHPHLEHMHDAPTREIEPAPCVTQVQRTRRSGNDLGQEGVPTSTPDTTTTTTTISVRRKGRSEERCMKGQNRVNSSDRRIEFFTLPTRLFYTSSHPSHHV